MQDIDKIKKLLEVLGAIAVAGVKVGKDGKLNISDLKHLMDLAEQLDDVVEIVGSLKEIVEESKDLDQAEVLEIIGELYKITNEINKAV